MRSLNFLIPFFAIVIFLGGCSNKEEDPRSDFSFITKKPCVAPCWYGLELEISTEEEVFQTIKILPFVDPKSVRELGTVWNDDQTAIAILFDCSHPQKQSCGSATVSENKLKVLSLVVTYSLNMETIVEKYGAPNLIGYGSFHPETGGCNLGLYWPDQEIIARNSSMYNDQLCKQISKTGKIPPNILVTDLTFIVKEKFEFKEGQLIYKPWPGFSSDIGK